MSLMAITGTNLVDLEMEFSILNVYLRIYPFANGKIIRFSYAFFLANSLCEV